METLLRFTDLEQLPIEDNDLNRLLALAEHLYRGLWSGQQHQSLLAECRHEFWRDKSNRQLQMIAAARQNRLAVPRNSFRDFAELRERHYHFFRNFYPLMLRAAEQRPELFSTAFLQECRSGSTLFNKVPLQLLNEERATALELEQIYALSRIRLKNRSYLWREIYDRVQYASPRLREQASKALLHAMLEAEPTIQGVYRELLAKRRELSYQAECRSYEAFLAMQRGPLHLSLERRLAFYELYREHILPLIAEMYRQSNRRQNMEKRRLWQLFQFHDEAFPALAINDDAVMATFCQSIERLTGDDQSLIKQLIDMDYYETDLAFPHLLPQHPHILPEQQLLFLALPYEGKRTRIFDWFRELGMSVAEIAQLLKEDGLQARSAPSFIRELSAWAMLMANHAELEGFYGENSELAMDLWLSQALLQLALLTARDAFELAIYGPDPVKVEDFPAIFKEIQSQFLPFFDEDDSFWRDGKAWLLLGLGREEPLNGLDRCLACVLILAEKPFRSKWAQLEKKLNRLFGLDFYADPLGACVKAGFQSPLSEEAMKTAVFAVADRLEL